MAEELEWIELRGTGTAGQVNSALASWRNETGHDVSLRDVYLGFYATTTGIENVRVQVSKQNVMIQTDGDRNWKVFGNSKSGTNNGFSAVDASINIDRQVKYGKGQVIVEKNETLYLHNDLANNIINDQSWAVIGYHAND